MCKVKAESHTALVNFANIKATDKRAEHNLKRLLVKTNKYIKH